MHEHAAEAPAFLLALEQSGIGQTIRQAAWLYPIANTAHILALMLFAAAAAVMDLRILGAFGATAPASVIVPARRASMLGLGLMVLTGLMLFLPDAARVGVHPVFQIKLVLIAFGIANALLIAGPALRGIAAIPANVPLPAQARAAALLSLAVWLCVAACGRLIAYF
jgi:hypothetical protein